MADQSAQQVAVVDADGQVVNIIMAAPRPEVGWLGIPDGVAAGIGWSYDGSAFLPPPSPPAPPPSPAELLAVLADLRWRREAGGITVEGLSVATDRDAQAMLTGAALAASLEGETYSVRWKTLAGFVTLSGAQVLALATAVRAHVQRCFDAEAVVAELVEAGEITTHEALREAWASA